jgi:hypothetical protein
MLQIFSISRQRAKTGLIGFHLLALMVLFTACKREAEVQPQHEATQSPVQPAQSPEQPAESPQAAASPQPQELHARVVADVRAFATQLEEYKTAKSAYPTTAQGLGVLGSAHKDPWDSDYIYQCPSTRNRESYDLFSAGPDHKPDTPDDDWGEE